MPTIRQARTGGPFSVTWFTLALLCALSLATADALTKRWFAGYPGLDLLAARLVTPALLLSLLVFLQPWPDVPPAFWGSLAVLIPMELTALFLYMVAIRDHPLHLTVPYLAFTPVFNLVTAYLVLGESVSGGGSAGIALVVAGAYALNLQQPSEPGSWAAPLKAIVRERGSRLMLCVAAIYSLTSVGSKAAMGYTTPEIFGPLYYSVIGASLVLMLLVVRPSSLSVLAQRPSACLVVGVLMSLMIITHFMALARVEVAYFVSVKRTSLLFGIVYGALLFGERDLMRNLVAGALMVMGVALIVGR